MRPATSYNIRKKGNVNAGIQPTTAPIVYSNSDKNESHGGSPMMAPQSPRASSSYSRYRGVNKTIKPEGSLTMNNTQNEEKNPLTDLLQSRIRATSASATNRPTLPHPIPKPPPPQSAHQLENFHIPPSSLSLTYGAVESSRDYEFSPDMSIDEALLYLTEHPECQFLHVTTMSALDKYSNTTFYDLVVLEKPGYPDSGLVWSKQDRKRQFLLHEQVMQLSLNSLLYVDEYHGNVCLPINQYLYEREIVRQLRSKGFFRYYHEFKVLYYWRRYVQRTRYDKRRKELETKSFYSDPPLIQGRLDIRSVTYSLHCSTDLFAYHPPGAVNIVNFLSLQIQRIEQMTEIMKKSILELFEKITAHYEIIVSNEYLAEEIECIIEHHPYNKGLRLPNQPVDSEGNIIWDEVRAIQRLKNEGLQKIIRLLVVGQYMLDHVLVDLMEKFWLRFSQQTRGVPRISHRPKDRLATWSIEDFSEQNGYFSPEPMDIPLNSIEFQSQLLDPQNIPTTQVFASQLLAGNDSNYLISKEAQSTGSYLKVDVALMSMMLEETMNPLHIDLENNSWSLSTVKVRPLPTKQSTSKLVQDVYKALSRFLEEIPNMRDHPVVLKGALAKPKIDLSEDELARLQSDGSSSNSRYFTNLKMSSILASPSLFTLAVKCMHQIREAYSQSTSIEPALTFLNSSFRRIWLINVESLCKQVDRSLLLVKIRDVIERDVMMIDNLENILARDQSKLTAIIRSVEQLQQTRNLTQQLFDIRHSYGMITCFDYILNQLDAARLYQMRRILLKLPLAFITRCRAFSEYCSKLKAYYTNDSSSLTDIVFLLLKLKNFDRAKVMFDAEMDICDSLYALIMQYLPTDNSFPEQSNSSDSTSTSILDKTQTIIRRNSYVSNRMNSTTNHIMQKHRQNVINDYNQYSKDRDNLWEAVGKSRMFVLSHLVHIGSQIRYEINSLHLEINNLSSKVAQADLTKIANLVHSSSSAAALPENQQQQQQQQHVVSPVSPVSDLKNKSKILLQRYDRGALSDTYSILRELGGAINLLRQKVTTNIHSQQLIHEGNDIVGSAIIGLDEKDMDNFIDMDILEDLFKSKYRACTTIVEINDAVRNMSTVRLGTCDINGIFKTYSLSLDTIEYLKNKKGNENIIELLQGLLNTLRPVLELAACLKTDSMKLRHWINLNQNVFEPCHMELSFDDGGSESSIDNIRLKSLHHNTNTNPTTSTITDTTSTGTSTNMVPFHDGSIRSISVQSIYERGISNHLNNIQLITANACMENMIERVLFTIYNTMKSLHVVLSSEWIDNNSYINNKMFFQLHCIINCKQLNIIIQYCLRALNVIEHTAIDMKLLYLFYKSIDYLSNILYDMLYFIKNIELIQYQWYNIFPYVKYSPQGELDRETERLYQITTEEFKRIEILLQNIDLKLLYNALYQSYEQAISTNLPLNNLQNIIEDINSNTQSMLDAYPRLSLLPYHRTKKLIKLWNIGSYESIEYITECIHELFPGVGQLELYDDTSTSTSTSTTTRTKKCLGIISTDLCEKILFGEIIIFDNNYITLDQFLKNFEYQLRLVLSRSCDMIIIEYIQLLKDMTGELSLDIIYESIREIFRVRINLIKDHHHHQSSSGTSSGNKTSQKNKNTSSGNGNTTSGGGSSNGNSYELNDKPNQSIILINRCIFAENMWLCLGYPIGSIYIARPDIISLKSQLSEQWRILIQHYIDECYENLIYLQTIILSSKQDEKYLSLCSTLLQLEISYINILQEILLCPCLDSATELWISKYQLRYLYDKYERYQNSPLEVTIGCVSVPYGLEYQGGTVVALTGYHLENAIHKVIGSAYMSKGTVFISHEKQQQQQSNNNNHNNNHNNSNIVYEAIGECVVSPRDVATALGRIHTTISSLCTEYNVKLFLSRLLYLDAVGSIDMTTIDHTSLQMLLTTLSDMWIALERKDDYFMVGALKYPLYTRLSSNPLHMTRKKNNMNDLREHLNARGKNFFGLFVIGIASELTYTDETIMDYLSKNSSFNIISVEHSRPIDDLGLMLCVEGFKYGVLLQLIFHDIMKELYKILQYQQTILTYLSSTLLIRTIVKQCKILVIHGKYNLLRQYSGTTSNDTTTSTSTNTIPDSKILKLESECFYHVLLEQLMKLGHCSIEDFDETHRIVRTIMQEHLDNVIDPEYRFDLTPPSHIIPDRTRRILSHSMEELGYIQGSMFLEQCSVLWKLMSSNNPVIIISGPPGCGKTAIRNCVLDGIKREGFDTSHEFTNVSALQNWRSAKILCRAIKKWLALRKNTKPTESSPKPQPTQVHVARHVYSTVIHHSSLTLEYILGSFDDSGRWQDGLLLRQLRATDDIAEKHSNDKQLLSQILILQGPLGSHLEQLLSVTQYSNHANVTSIASDTHRVSFPSGEMCVLDPSVTILIETSDLTMASPQFLMQLPQVSCGVTPDYCSQRIITVWLQSLTSWLRQFPPWKDILIEMNQILNKTDFIKEMLRCDMTSSEMNSITALTRTTTFLRYLEQLIQQVHELTIQECLWNNESLLSNKKNTTTSTANITTSHSLPLDTLNTTSIDDSLSAFDNLSIDSDNEEEVDDSLRNTKTHRFPTLTVKDREKLNSRVKLILAYSAIWGFGGGVNGTKRRMFFDLLARQSIETYLNSTSTSTSTSSVYLPYECNLFEISLNLKECCFIHSLTLTKLLPTINTTSTTSGSGGGTSIHKKEYIGNEEIIETMVKTLIIPSTSSTSTSSTSTSLPHIKFLTGSMCAVKSAFNLLLQSGGNILITGLSGSGKTTLIHEILESYGKSCPSPQTMKDDIMKKLLEIIGDGIIPDGIPAVLDLLDKVINDLDKLPLINDKIATDSIIWQQIQTKIKKFSIYKTASEHCNKNTIFSYMTSIQNHSTASSFRQWLIRELRSETDGILEPPRDTYGIIFIDDMHLCCNDTIDNYFKIIKDTNRIVCDRVDSLIRGLVEDYPSFNILRNINKSRISLTSKMPIISEYMPTLHKEFYTQPTRPDIMKEENYYINQLGVILGATGDIKLLQKSLNFSSLITHFNIIGIPLLSDDEIRSILVHGIKECIYHGPTSSTSSSSTSSTSTSTPPLSDILTKLLRELTSYTLSIANIIQQNQNICTTLEKSIIKNTIPQLTFLKRFCLSFYSGSKYLLTTTNLLNLWCHEWKRNVLDPLPYGGLKQRYQWAWCEKMNRLDMNIWNINPKWLQSYLEEFNHNTDAIWVNCNLLESPLPSSSHTNGNTSTTGGNTTSTTTSTSIELDYSPLRFDMTRFNSLYNSHLESIIPPVLSSESSPSSSSPSSHKITELNIPPDSTGMNNLRSVLYPHAMSNVLRILRILNSTNLNILILSGVGSCIQTGIKLASTLSGLYSYFFNCCNRPISLINGISDDLRISFDIIRFLKNVILESAGYCYSNEQKSRGILFERMQPKKILAVILSSQLLSSNDRKKLLCIMNKSDPSSLFNDAEILGMVTALRKSLVEENMNLAKQQQQQQQQHNSFKPFEETKADNGTTSNSNGESNVPIESTSSSSFSSKLDRIIDSSGRTTQLNKRIPIIAGYTFQWLKNQIIQTIQQNLRIALCVDIPRAVEYIMPSDTQRLLDHGDKFDTRMDDLNSKTINLTNQTMNASTRTLKRFTLLSKSALYQQAYGGIHKADTSMRKSQGNDPTSATTGSNNEGNLDNNWTSSEYLNSISNMINPGDINIFNCPILGNTIQYLFVPIWWDAQREESALGICNTLLSPNKTSKFNNYNQISTSINLIIPFQYSSSTTSTSTTSSSIVQNSRNILVSTHMIERNFMKILSNIPLLGVLGSYSTQNIFDDYDLITSNTMNITRRHRSLLGRRISLLAATETTSAPTTTSATSGAGSGGGTSSNISVLNDEINQYIDQMLIESQSLLASLLSYPLPSDTLLLSQPVLCLSPERECEIASIIVRSILEAGIRMLLIKKQNLNDAMLLENDALIVLNSLQPVRECLEQSQHEIMLGMRIISKKLTDIKNEIFTISTNNVETIEYKLQNEYLHMIYEDMNSCDEEISYQYQLHENNLLYCRTLIKSIHARDWIEFSKLFHNKNTSSHTSSHTSSSHISKKLIYIMCSLLMIVNHLPHEELPSSISSYDNLSSNYISKMSINALKSMDFVNSISNFKPNTLLSSQYKHLVLLNKLIQTQQQIEYSRQKQQQQQQQQQHEENTANDHDDDNNDNDTTTTTTINSNLEDQSLSSIVSLTTTSMTTKQRYPYLTHTSTNTNHTSMIENLTIEEKLISYLLKLQEFYEFTEYMNEYKEKISCRKSSLVMLQNSIHEERNKKTKLLEEEYKLYENDLHLLDTLFIQNKERLLRITSLQNHNPASTSTSSGTGTSTTTNPTSTGIESNDINCNLYSLAIKENLNYIKKEIEQIDVILNHIVADCCIAVTILVRVGWLPDQIRQESLDSLRNFLKSDTTFIPSDSPYILGCLIDRLQIRTWTPYLKNGLIRDPPSINAMSLYYLSPAYTFIIDPDGIAENALLPIINEESLFYQVSGLGFNLETLENIIQRGKLVNETKITILVSEIQAGASPDLIALLSSDIDTITSTSSTTSSTEGVDTSGVNIDSSGLRSSPTPSSSPSSSLPHEYNLRCTFNSQQTLDKHKCLILLSKVRIILISTEPPTLDHQGIGRPLPPSCFKNMTIIHWVSSITNSFYIDSKPLATTMNKSHTGTTLIESYIVDTLQDKISPISKLNLINTRIIDYTLELYLIESTAYNTVLNWIRTRKDNFIFSSSSSSSSTSSSSSSPLSRLSQYITQPIFDLNFLESEECCRILLESHNKRHLLSRSFINISKLERDSLMYQKVFLDACSMVANFIRMCKLLIPLSDLPPYALNIITICNKCIRPFMLSTRFHKYCRSIPESMQNLKRFNKGLRLFQAQIRKRIRSRTCNESSQTSSILSPSVVLTTTPPSASTRTKKSSISALGDSPGRRLSLVLKANQISEFIHITMSDREKLMDDLAVLVQPLRTKLLQAVYDYTHTHVHPGKEWLVKLSITLCAWSQASLPPTEELRTFINFINHRSHPFTTLYSVNSSEKKEDHQTGQIRQSVMQRNSSIRKSTNFSSNSFSNIDISSRSETFWIKDHPTTTSTTSTSPSSRSTTVAMSHAVNNAEWMIRGDGILDGVWINQHSLRWRINYLTVRQDIKRNIDGTILARPISYWDPVFCDASKPLIVTKNALFQAITRGEDYYLLEWMRLLGMKPHHDYYSKSLIKGGQAKFSSAVLTALHKSKINKNTEILGVNKKSILYSKRLTNTTKRISSSSSSNSVTSSNTSRTSTRLPSISHTSAGTSTTTTTHNTNPSSSTQLRKSIRSRTIRKQSVIFHNPVVSSPSGDLSLSLEFSKQQAHAIQQENYANEAEKFSSALRKPTTSITIKPQISNTGFRPTTAATSTSASTAPVRPELKKGSSTTSAGNNLYNEQKSLENLLTTTESRINFKLLEKHSTLSPIFHGMSMGIGQYLEEFIEWKLFLESLSNKNFTNLTIHELVHLTAKLIPPQLESDEEENSNLGLWASGKELSVLQTFLLIYAVVPSACEAVANIYFSLCLTYLRNGNVILKHIDESWEDERSDSDDDDYDEENDEENDNDDDDERKMKIQRIKEEDEEDEEDDDDEAEQEDPMINEFSNSVEMEPSVDTLTSSVSLSKDVGRFQDGIFDLNCWTKLKRIAAGTEKGRRVIQSHKRSKWQLCCRDFENWESVLLNIYTKFPDTNKSSMMKSIRDSFNGNGPLFLATDQPHHHMASITHRAREYYATNCTLNSNHCIITNCRLDILDGFYQSGDVSIENIKILTTKMKNIREKVGILTKSSTNLIDSSSSSSSSSSKASYAIEMIDLNSSFGNILMESAFHKIPYELPTSTSLVSIAPQPGLSSPSRHGHGYTTTSIDNQPSSYPSKRSSISNGSEFIEIPSNKLSPRVPSIVSAEWNYLHSYHKGKYGHENTKAYGTSPFLYIGLLSTHWLHQYTLQDIIGCTISSPAYTIKIQNKLRSLEQSNLCISPVISRGIIIDELEGSVLSIIQSLKKSARTKLNRSICEKLRYSSKLEMMCASSVYILWKMSLTLQCKLQELNDLPPCWSICLETLSLWQTARIVLKISDILKPSKWEHIFKWKPSLSAAEYASEIRKDSTFCRLIWLLVESFCRISFDGKPSTEKMMMTEEDPATTTTSRNKRSRLSILIRQESLQGKNPEDFLSNYREVINKSPTKFRNVIGKDFKPSDTTTQTDNGVPVVMNNTIPRRPIKEKPSVIRRRKREKEKIEAATALANNANRVSFESLSSLTLHTLGPNRRHFISTELRNRVASVIGVYLSHIIAAQKVTSSMNTTTTNQSSTIKRGSSILPFTKALPDQVNIVSPSKLNQMRTTTERTYIDPGERWPIIDWKSCDITVGSLQWNEVLSTLLLWTRSDLLIGVESTELEVARRRTSYAKLRSSMIQWAKSDQPKLAMSDSLSIHS